MRRFFWSCSIACSLGLHANAQEPSGPLAGQAPAAPLEAPHANVTPAQVFGQVAFLRAEIDLIRLELGKPEIDAPPIQVEKAAPREVYFQAVPLFRKAERLAFEHTRERVDEPPFPAGEIQMADVDSAVHAALKRVQRVKAALKISEQSEVPPLDPAIEPSQVFDSIVAANRELNHLLDQRFAPGDVFQQATTAIAYLSRLLDTPGEISTPPEPPPFERRKRPADVYRRLIDCFALIRRVGEQTGVPMLNLIVDDEQVERVQPSDVYDVASLLVSELAHLHGQKANAAPPRNVYNPGRKLPSHVYQRIGILYDQLEALQRVVEQNPDWLKN